MRIKSYQKSYFEDCKNDIKNRWNGIKSIMYPGNSKVKVSRLNIYRKTFSTTLEITSEFNNFFVDVDPTSDKDFPTIPPNRISPGKFLRNRNQVNFIITHI